jgi:16S rRNA (guanine527-N7)-methyltransferase
MPSPSRPNRPLPSERGPSTPSAAKKHRPKSDGKPGRPIERPKVSFVDPATIQAAVPPRKPAHPVAPAASPAAASTAAPVVPPAVASAVDPEAGRSGTVDPAAHPPVAFSADDWAWFLARCEALEIPQADSKRAVIEALYGHLLGVNTWLNLTRLTTPRDFLKQHVLDSLSLIGDSRLRHLKHGGACADLGSGGGYPGLPLALWHPMAPWHLIDARVHKARFLDAAGTIVKAHGGTTVRGHHLRGADAAHGNTQLRRACQLVVSRAMASAPDVCAQAAHLLAKHGHLIIYKGPAFAKEEADATGEAAYKCGYRLLSLRHVVLEEGDPERVQVILERIA